MQPITWAWEPRRSLTKPLLQPGTVILTRVVPASPAAKAGLRAGDRIYRAAGSDFVDEREFQGLVKAASERLPLLVERDGQLRTVVVHFPVEPNERAA